MRAVKKDGATARVFWRTYVHTGAESRSLRSPCRLGLRTGASRDLRQLRRGYRMWVFCGSPDRFFKEATSTDSELRRVSNVGPAVLPHSLRTRLQCDRVETPFGVGDDAVTDVCQKGDRATVLRNP